MNTQKQLNYFECENPVKMVLDLPTIGEVLEYELPNNSINDIIKDLQETHGIDIQACKRNSYDDIKKSVEEHYRGEDVDCDIWYEDEIEVQTIYSTIVLLNGEVYTYNFVSCLDRDIFINEINKQDKHIKTFLGTSCFARTRDEKLISSMDEALEKAQDLLLKK